MYVVLYSIPKGLGYLTIMAPRNFLCMRGNFLFGSRGWMIRFPAKILFKLVSFRLYSVKCGNTDSESSENEELDRKSVG